jgi:hypothetical protein
MARIFALLILVAAVTAAAAGERFPILAARSDEC